MTVRDQGRIANRNGHVVQALWVGAALQLVCIVLPLLDFWIFQSVESHVQATYSQWRPAEVAGDRNAIIAYLVGVGVAGLIAWLAALWFAQRGRWVRGIVTTLFVVGIAVLILNAGIGGGAYDQIIPLWLGLTLLGISALPGLTALVSAWRKEGR